MSTVESVIYQLMSGLINQTSIPRHFLYDNTILEIIQKYNWLVSPSSTIGWVDLRRIVTYSG
jgi:hypothetical protein